ncbi:MAG: HAMP domain-containing histidine kinase [Acidobacteria bacterium]|nr:HAMP domain-containing histidine kinase [Acidobacteriota bacterium]
MYPEYQPGADGEDVNRDRGATQHVKAALSWSESEIHELRQTVIRNEMKSQSAGKLPEAIEGIAHDFSNLLEAAGTVTTSLHWSAQNTQHYREAMRGVMEQAQALLDCLLEMAHPAEQPWRTEAVDLRSIVDQALSAALLPLREPLIRVRVRVGGLDPVRVHRSVVFRALVNLIWNAVQAMPHGGMLSLVGYVRGNRVVLEVSDTGTGISRDDLQKVFNEPFSTKPGHRGLGLSLVRDLLAKCGGELTYSSRPDRGSSFCLALPMARTTELARPALVPARRKVSELVAVGKYDGTRSAKNAAAPRAMPPAKNHRPVVLQS